MQKYKNTMYKYVILFVSIHFLVFCPLFPNAKPIDRKSLIKWGTIAFQQKMSLWNQDAASLSLKNYHIIEKEEVPTLAVLNFQDGFLVMSADDAAMPILAYSPTGNFDINSVSPGAKMLIEQYQQEIQALREQKITASLKTQQQWTSIKTNNCKDVPTVVVAPLLTAKWNQTKYYNRYSPEDTASPAGYDSRTPNGCVAVAMAMIMYYYRYPEQGQGSHTNYSFYGNFEVDFSQQHYCYEAMEDELRSHNNEVAKLIFHCATSVDMMYAPEGSGAYSEDVPNAMSNYFKYNPKSTILHKYSYSDSQWCTLLQGELDKHRPLYFSGYSSEGGHAFVCDGYNSDNYFHFNFGWGGYGDGYYLTSGADNEEVVHGYGGGQSFIKDLYPNAADYPNFCNSKIVKCTKGTLEDGSNVNDYQNNAHCTYVITEDSMISVTVNMQQFETEENHDFLEFWNGNPKNGDLLLSLSGEMPSKTSYTFNTDSLYVVFTSDEANTAAGWRFSFQIDRKTLSCNSGYIRQYSGELTDGSGEDPYMSNANCTWKFRLPLATRIQFTFHSLDISPEDRLSFYDVSSGKMMLLDEYSGSEVPKAPIIYESNNLYATFTTDNYLNRDGFWFSWVADSAGVNIAVDDYQNQQMTLYPNPASETVNISMPASQDNVQITVYDVAGKAVLKTISSGEATLNTRELPNGFYVVVCHNKEFIFKQKLIIEH